jgi:type 1 fimbriae regulatory protein FimB
MQAEAIRHRPKRKDYACTPAKEWHPYNPSPLQREAKAIKDWLAVRQKMSQETPTLGSGDTLFLSERRRPLSRVTVWVLFQKLAKAAGLEDLELHPHMLRHACGYSLANRGADTRLIQDLLGHRNITHTVRYTKLAPGRFERLF